MSPKVERPDPPYMQVVKHLRGQIQSGELADGQMLDSVRTIGRKWEISLATATKVVASLKAEGLVRGEPGRGTIVTRQQTASSPKDRLLRSLGGRIYAENERAEIKNADLVPATDGVADALGVAHGSTVIRRYRVTFRDDAPASASTSWFVGDMAESSPALMEAGRIKQGTPKYIEETTGLVATSGEDKVCADVASGPEAKALHIPLGSPVLRKRNWVYAADGAVIEYGESVAVPLRWSTHNYEISR